MLVISEEYDKEIFIDVIFQAKELDQIMDGEIVQGKGLYKRQAITLCAYLQGSKTKERIEYEKKEKRLRENKESDG